LRRILLAVVFIMVFATSCFAAGFGLYEFSARGNALGGTLAARADDPSALSYNPAGITQLEGDHIMFGLTAIRPQLDIIIGGVAYGNEVKTWIPPHFYYTRQLDDRYWFGLSLTSRFGLGSEFKEDWPGRYNNYYACIQSVSLTPTLAMKVSDQFSVAVGVEAMWFEFEQKKKIPTPYGDVDAGLKGDDMGWGWNLGLHFRPTEKLKLGLFYRSEVDQTVEGNVNFQLPSAELATLFPDTTGSGAVTTPASFTVGAAYQISEKTSIEADAMYIKWSSYKDLTIKYGEVIPAIGTDKVSTPKNWDDVWRYQLGIEHALTDNSWLRLGYVYDNSPVPDETIDYIVPANDRQIYSIGYGFTKDKWTWDLSYSYLDIKDRNIPGNLEEGVFPSSVTNADTHMLGVTVTYSF